MIALQVWGYVAPVRTEGNVLAYSTNVTIGGLNDAQNNARASNGLGPLALNNQLNAAAQAKAQDMVARNYWSHNTPDGNPPWLFITNAGYSYERAGENLAYSFDTSSAVVTGWMNSAGHRANVLDDSFTQVGFGIANGTNYQGAPNTVVVAFYAQPIATAPAPTPAPAAPAAPTGPSSGGSSGGATAPAAPGAPGTPAPTPVVSTTPDAGGATASTSVPPSSAFTTSTGSFEPASKRVSSLRGAMNGTASWQIIISALGLLIGLAWWLLTHSGRRLVWRARIKIGKRYLLHHPLVDLGIIAGGLLLLFSTSIGMIK